jgi:hypothetical protein
MRSGVPDEGPRAASGGGRDSGNYLLAACYADAEGLCIHGPSWSARPQTPEPKP